MKGGDTGGKHRKQCCCAECTYPAPAVGCQDPQSDEAELCCTVLLLLQPHCHCTYERVAVESCKHNRPNVNYHKSTQSIYDCLTSLHITADVNWEQAAAHAWHMLRWPRAA